MADEPRRLSPQAITNLGLPASATKVLLEIQEDLADSYREDFIPRIREEDCVVTVRAGGTHNTRYDYHPRAVRQWMPRATSNGNWDRQTEQRRATDWVFDGSAREE